MAYIYRIPIFGTTQRLTQCTVYRYICLFKLKIIHEECMKCSPNKMPIGTSI